MFCDRAEVPFDKDIFKVTACTGAAAAQLTSGMTIHSAAQINMRKVNHISIEWESTNTVFIDEISFMSSAVLQKLDNNLRTLTGKRDKLFGGLNVIFVGDFRQLKPVVGNPVYEKYSCICHGAINKEFF